LAFFGGCFDADFGVVFGVEFGLSLDSRGRPAEGSGASHFRKVHPIGFPVGNQGMTMVYQIPKTCMCSTENQYLSQSAYVRIPQGSHTIIQYPTFFRKIQSRLFIFDSARQCGGAPIGLALHCPKMAVQTDTLSTVWQKQVDTEPCNIT
jgi:hypothetical protein